MGIRQAERSIEVANLSYDGTTASVLTGLEDFWSARRERLFGRSDRLAVFVADVQLVPPVFPGARVICIGLNYLRHVAEGSYRHNGVPKLPDLFARWTKSLTVGDDEILVPVDEELDWGGEVVARVGGALIDADPNEALAAVVEVDTLGVLRNRVVSSDYLRPPAYRREPSR